MPGTQPNLENESLKAESTKESNNFDSQSEGKENTSTVIPWGPRPEATETDVQAEQAQTDLENLENLETALRRISNPSKDVTTLLRKIDRINEKLKDVLLNDELNPTYDSLQEYFIQNLDKLSKYKELTEDVLAVLAEEKKYQRKLKSSLTKTSKIKKRWHTYGKSIFSTIRPKKNSSIGTMPNWKRDLLAIRPKATDFGLRLDKFKKAQELDKEQRLILERYIKDTPKKDIKQSLEQHEGDLSSFFQKVVMPKFKEERKAEAMPKVKEGRKAEAVLKDKKDQKYIVEYGNLLSNTEGDKVEWKAIFVKMREKEAYADLELFFKSYVPKRTTHDLDKKQSALKCYMKNRSPRDLKIDLGKRAIKNHLESFLIYLNGRRPLEFVAYAMQNSEDLTDKQLAKKISIIMQAHGKPVSGQKFLDYFKEVDALAPFIVKRYKDTLKVLLEFNNLEHLFKEIKQQQHDDLTKREKFVPKEALKEIGKGRLSTLVPIGKTKKSVLRVESTQSVKAQNLLEYEPSIY